MRGLVLTAALFFCISEAAIAQPENAEAIEVTTFVVDLRPRDRQDRVVGQFRFMGGIVLRSTDRRFGGISGLRFLPDGDTLLAVSDRGNWISLRPLFEGEALVGAVDARLWPMLGVDGAPLESPAFDAESLTLVGDTAFVSFEREHRIDAYHTPWGTENPRPTPYRSASAFGALENNGGLEGLTNLADGRFLAFAEAPRSDNTFDGWLMDAEGGTQSLALLAQDPYRVTDLATLPNGDIVSLERRFSPIGGVGARLRHIALDRINPSALADGNVIAELGSGYTVDNMEGLAVREHEGRTEIFIISDDNQNPLQRTILMAFELTR